MERTERWYFAGPRVLGLCAAILINAGCHRAPDETSAAARSSKESTAEAKGPSPALADVNRSLKEGAFDDAAARLLELQQSGRNFTAKEAADYRKARNEAYTRALEAAEKGDKRAEAALQMIRAGSPH